MTTLSDEYTDEDGLDITCRNCDVTAREFFEVLTVDEPSRPWMIGTNWYCSDDCYDEATRDEG